MATRTPDTITLHGTVVWDDWDNASGLRPDSVIVHAQGASSAGAMVPVAAGPDGTWTWEIAGLRKRSGSTDIAYVVSEDTVEGYTTEVTGNAEEGYTITSRLADHSYTFTKGGDGSWTRGSTTTLDFTVEHSRDDETTFGHFTGIQVDGKDVPKDAYEAQAGSVIIKVAPAYLEGLADGSHAIVANFNDGVARSGFTVTTASTPGSDPTNTPGSGSGSTPHVLPNTSDPLFGAVLLFLSSASVVLYLVARRLKMSHVRKR